MVFSRQVSCALPPDNLREINFSLNLLQGSQGFHSRAVTDDGLGAVAVDVDLPVAVAFHRQRI